MRTIIWDYLTEKLGKFSPENQKTFVKETKRLEKVWRKDKTEFLQAIKVKSEYNRGLIKL